MNKILLAAFIAIATHSAYAEPLGIPPGKPPVAAIVKKCSQGCFILDPVDLQTFREAIAAAQRQAFEAGLAAGVAKEKGTI